MLHSTLIISHSHTHLWDKVPKLDLIPTKVNRLALYRGEKKNTLNHQLSLPKR